MEVAIRKMGNSQGILIPKPILAQLGLEGGQVQVLWLRLHSKSQTLIL
jgi:antitoxin MazE